MGFRFNPLTGLLDLVGQTVYRKLKVTVPASTIQDVDSVLLSKFASIDYTVSIKNDSQNKRRGFKMLVRRTDTTLKNQVYAKNGDPLSVLVDTTIVGLTHRLRITNSETFAVDLIITRALL